jgi:DHA3 family macrolide efflux protein-like MFS transporter
VTAAPVPVPTPVGPFAIFRNRYFVYLWTGQLVSTIGDALTSLAAGIIVYQVTRSILNVGIMLMVSSIPTLVFGLVAGVFVDRFDRKTIMIASVVIRAGLVAAIPLSLALTNDILWLYVIVLLSASVQQFFDPANDSVLPEIASEEELAAANSLMAIAQFGSTAIGFALAGLLIGTSLELVFWIDAATFLFSGLMISLVAVKPLEVAEKTTVGDVVRNLGVGARFILRSPVLRSATLVRAPAMVVFGLQAVLLLPFAIEVLRATAFEYGLQEGITSVGFVIGSLLMARYTERVREGSWLLLSFLGMGIAGLLYALSRNIWVAIAVIGVSGVLNAPSFVASRLINQRNTPREMRGRVFSTTYVIREVMYLIGMGLAGLADIWDVRIMFALSSGLLILIALAGSRLPGIGQPAAEWGRTITLLLTAPRAPLGATRAVVPADIEALGRYIPALAGMPERDRDRLAASGRVVTANAGTAITRAGDSGDSAYFIMSGRLAVGAATEGGEYRSLGNIGAGDVIGEIAALTGSTRTADVVAEEETELMEVPAATLRQLMAEPEFGSLVLGKMTERLARTASIGDLPRFGRIDQQALREMRSKAPESRATTKRPPPKRQPPNRPPAKPRTTPARPSARKP